jgi:hypothetical protein
MSGPYEERELNPNFRDILFALSDENADFLIVGAHALGFHGIARATGDLDILVRPSPENAQRVWRAMLRFGAPLSGLSIDDLSKPDTIFVMGREPQRIDIITDIDGIEFENAWRDKSSTVIDGRPMPILSLQSLLVNKRAVGRPKDLLDVEWIEYKLKQLEQDQ